MAVAALCYKGRGWFQLVPFNPKVRNTDRALGGGSEHRVVGPHRGSVGSYVRGLGMVAT